MSQRLAILTISIRRLDMGMKLSEISDPKLREEIQRRDVIQNARQIFKKDLEGASLSTKRIRQSGKPLMNKLESEWHQYLCYGDVKCLRPQAVKLKIGTNAFYKPDFSGFVGDKLTLWEVKGNKGKNIDRGKLALKVAAFQWPEFDFILVWKQDGAWQAQRILP